MGQKGMGDGLTSTLHIITLLVINWHRNSHLFIGILTCMHATWCAYMHEYLAESDRKIELWEGTPKHFQKSVTVLFSCQEC